MTRANTARMCDAARAHASIPQLTRERRHGDHPRDEIPDTAYDRTRQAEGQSEDFFPSFPLALESPETCGRGIGIIVWA